MSRGSSASSASSASVPAVAAPAAAGRGASPMVVRRTLPSSRSSAHIVIRSSPRAARAGRDATDRREHNHRIAFTELSSEELYEQERPQQVPDPRAASIERYEQDRSRATVELQRPAQGSAVAGVGGRKAPTPRTVKEEQHMARMEALEVNLARADEELKRLRGQRLDDMISASRDSAAQRSAREMLMATLKIQDERAARLECDLHEAKRRLTEPHVRFDVDDLLVYRAGRGLPPPSRLDLEALNRRLVVNLGNVQERLRAMSIAEADAVAAAQVEQEDKSKCVVCYDRPRTLVFDPCGHMAVCEMCYNPSPALPIMTRCPLCRTNVGKPIRVIVST